MLPLEEESYLLYINLYYKNLGYEIYITILKNHMQNILDAIIGKKQTEQYYTHFPPFEM